MNFFTDFYVFFHNRIEDFSTILYKQIFIPKLIKQITPAFSRLNFRTSCGCLEKQVIFFLQENTMAYTKPQVVAQNASTGSYAAGCPTNERGGTAYCRDCERTE